MRQVAIRPVCAYNEQKEKVSARCRGMNQRESHRPSHRIRSSWHRLTERRTPMTNELASTTDDRRAEGQHTWDGAFGRRRVRIQWQQRPGYFRLHIQKPFPANNDPDGMG